MPHPRHDWGTRGLDIKNVVHVLNYDLARQSQGGIIEHVHRIGVYGGARRLININPPGKRKCLSLKNHTKKDRAQEMVKSLTQNHVSQ